MSGSDDKTIKIWNVESGSELRTLQGHAAAVTAVALSSDGQRAVTGSADRTIKVWDVESGHELRTLKSHLAPFSPAFATGTRFDFFQGQESPVS
jgi:WD40 repeat protein